MNSSKTIGRVGSFLFVASTLVACAAANNLLSASKSCPAVGSKICSGDTPVTKDQNNTCIGLSGDPDCGTLYVKFLDCLKANAVCNADSKFDDSATGEACASTRDPYAACIAKKTAGDGGLDSFDASGLDASGLDELDATVDTLDAAALEQ